MFWEGMSAGRCEAWGEQQPRMPLCKPSTLQGGSLEETEKEPPGEQLQEATGWGQFQEDRGVISTWVDKDKA